MSASCKLATQKCKPKFNQWKRFVFFGSLHHRSLTRAFSKPFIKIRHPPHQTLRFVPYIYELVELPDMIGTRKPLDYDNLTKLNTGLRERGMAEVREATLNYESIIKNRRFAIIYLLNKAFDEHKLLPFRLIIELFRTYPNTFIVSENGLVEIIEEEIEIAYMAGIPYAKVFDYNNSDEIFLKPIQGINMEEAAVGAPKSLIDILETIELHG